MFVDRFALLRNCSLKFTTCPPISLLVILLFLSRLQFSSVRNLLSRGRLNIPRLWRSLLFLVLPKSWSRRRFFLGLCEISFSFVQFRQIRNFAKFREIEFREIFERISLNSEILMSKFRETETVISTTYEISLRFQPFTSWSRIGLSRQRTNCRILFKLFSKALHTFLHLIMVLMVCAKRRVARWLLSLFSDVPCNKILRVSYIESSGARMVEIL